MPHDDYVGRGCSSPGRARGYEHARIARALLLVALVAVSAAAAAHRFVFRPPREATTVTLTGSAFGWDPNAVPMARQPDGTFAVETEIPEDRHTYKFVVDEKEWHHDPANPLREPDGHGGYNSVILTTGIAVQKLAPGTINMIQIHDLPKDFREPYIPVQFKNGGLSFVKNPDRQKGRLLLSREAVVPEACFTTSTEQLASRQLFVWLPSGYHASNARYPVVYLHDGQNVWDDSTCCFGHGGWALNTLMDTDTSIPRAILVGIPNSPARMSEYGLGDDILNTTKTPYLCFLQQVKRKIDGDFRTLPQRENTSIMGSSMGGVISIVAGYVYPEVYGNVAALSTAFRVPDARDHSLIDLLEQEGPGRFRLYLDSGTAGDGQDGAPLTRKFAKIAIQKGWPRHRFHHHEEPNAPHNEKAWRTRAHRPLTFLLTTPAASGD